MPGGIKGREVKKPSTLPKIKIREEPKLKMIKPVKVQQEAKEAMTRTEKNASKVAQSFVDHFTKALNKTPEGQEFLKTKVKNSEIGTLLFK